MLNFLPLTTIRTSWIQHFGAKIQFLFSFQELQTIIRVHMAIFGQKELIYGEFNPYISYVDNV